ncbi:PAS domain-containing protein [Belnapia moabensis]|uniref:PAS domain-containing protein n=1 Tax=Belnapia moabensis TaxID=365533 RepID=UPI0005B86CD3|nr:PAS domain-containing protein [Belnapia moabensis]
MSDTPGSTPSELAAEEARIGAEVLGLDRSTDPFVSAVRATRMPMIVTNPRLPDNPVIFANDAFTRLTGYAREEILGRNCRFLQGPESDPATVRAIHDAVEAREPIEIDIRNRRKDGSAFWNRLLIAPVRDAAGELTYFFASQLDVTTERERMAGLRSHNAALLAELNERLRSLEESEARLRFATEAGRLGIWELDFHSGDLTASPICRADFGLGSDAPFTYEVLRAALHAADRPRFEAAIAEGLRTGHEFGLECRVRRPDGRPGWIELRARFLRDAGGRPLRMAGTSRDITARKQQQARDRALLELDDRLRGLDDPAELAYAAAETLGRTLEVSRAGYGQVDPVAETIAIERDWNAPGIRSLAGLLHFRDYGTYIEDLKRGETVVFADAERDPRTAATAAALKAISAQAVINMPVTERNGLVALLYLNHATARDWRPEEMAFVRAVAERTRMAIARRQAEQDLKSLAASLESEVAARTAALMEAEAALRQSQKMEAVGQLTGGLAHDFNNLLAGIAGSLELMKTRIAQGRLNDVPRYLTAARGAADRAAALTHRLLAFSRRQTLEPKPTDANRLIAGLEDLVRRTVGPAITVEVVGAAGLWPVMVDRSQLENAVLNLCINARDAMPDGGRITVETANRWLDERAGASRDLPPGQYVAIGVSDTGSGMPPDIIAKAFDPFFTTKPLGQGTGLGLSMIYGFARQSGGQVRIYSEVGQGTLVTIYLPRHFGPTEEAEPAAASSIAPRAEHGETVLIVDDEPTVRMLVADVLGELGYTAIEAEDGAAGLRVLRSTARIDLLVTDVGLPGGMNGRQLADAGRALRDGLKVLFITGYAENAAIGHGHLEPGMHVLTKPFAMETLANRIREMIGAR